MKKISAVLASVALLSLFIVACSSLRTGYMVPATHPPLFEMGERRVYCVRCHGYEKDRIDFEKFNHTPYFTDNHRVTGSQDQRVCAMCHATSFCNTCHITPSADLKPSARYPTETYRRFQHRGDYLSRHMVEGRIDPSSCFRCHGNPRSARTCAPCHG